jgi:hypothetical protein
MDANVSVSVKHLVGCSPNLRRELDELIKNRRIVVEGPKKDVKVSKDKHVNFIDSYDGDGPARFPIQERAATGKVSGFVQELAMSLEVDNGSMICVMPRRTFERIQIPIQQEHWIR